MKLTLATATSMDYAVCVAAVFSGTACFPSKGIRQRTFENLVWLVWRLGQYQTLSGLAGRYMEVGFDTNETAPWR